MVINQKNQTDLERLSTKRRSASGGVMWRMLVFSVIVLVLIILTYVGVDLGYRTFLDSRVESMRMEAENLISGVSKEQQADVINYYSRLANMKILLDGHIRTSNLFKLLEERTNQNVYFTKVSLEIQDGAVKASGVAINYLELSRQLEALQQTEGVSEIELNSASINTNNQISFDITFNLDREILLSLK